MLSVVIPTRNRANMLSATLGSLTGQALSRDTYEVLVVDNGSTDETAAVAQAFSERLGNLRYFYESEPGLHAGRHRGMLESRGEILVFADDDVEAVPTWLSSIDETFSNLRVAMAGGNNLPKFLDTPPPWLMRLWERRGDRRGKSLPPLSILELAGPRRDFSPLQVWGCNFAIRKEVLLAAGGFHPDGMPEDLIRFRGDGETHVSRYVMESGNKCVFHPGASVYHKVSPERMTFSYFRRRGFNQGVSDSYTILRNEDAPAPNFGGNILRHYFNRGWRKIKDVILIDQEAKRALHEMRIGHGEGYAYHQRMYREDAQVREWVHKPKYF